MKISKFWLLIFSLILVGLVFGFIIERPYNFRGSIIDPAFDAPEFTLNSSQGGIYNLSSKTGKYKLLFFGYTFCPDVCPTTLFEMKEIKARLGDKAEHIEFIFITVDPQRDTEEQLAKYLASFDGSFFGLTGSEAEIEKVWKEYGVFREIQPIDNSLGYLVDHTSRLYLINSNNELMLTYINDTSLDDIVMDLKHLFKKENF